MIFQTQRLIVRSFEQSDLDLLFEMMSNPKVMDALPRPVKNREETEKTLNEFISLEKSTEIKWWCITENDSTGCIGLCGYKRNDQNEVEIGYCLNEQYWGKGYATEIVKELIEYGFQTMNFLKITADVTRENEKSVRVLEKFMTLEKEFYNEMDQCMDRRYFISIPKIS